MFTVPPESGEKVQPGDVADSLCVTRSDVCQAIKAGASVNTIKLAGRWKGDTWSIYSRMTSTAMYGVAADMVATGVRKQVSADNVRVR